MHDMNIIEIEGLEHRFPDGRQALDGVDLTVRKGEFVIIAGRNGSGKTTLLRHLNALLLPTKGTVKISGISVLTDPGSARRLVGMVFQDADSQIVGETVYEDVAFGPENLGLVPQIVRDHVNEALNAVGMAEFRDRRPHVLSGGEKRRLAIAGVLAMHPEIIVFDEPFTNLDYQGVCRLLEQIIQLNRRGHTILLTTHDLEKVIVHAHRLIILDSGRKVEDGVPEQILNTVEQHGVRPPCAWKLGLASQPWIK